MPSGTSSTSRKQRRGSSRDVRPASCERPALIWRDMNLARKLYENSCRIVFIKTETGNCSSFHWSIAGIIGSHPSLSCSCCSGGTKSSVGLPHRTGRPCNSALQPGVWIHPRFFQSDVLLDDYAVTTFNPRRLRWGEFWARWLVSTVCEYDMRTDHGIRGSTLPLSSLEISSEPSSASFCLYQNKPQPGVE